MRNIENYTKNYLQHDFEDYQVMYRRKKVLELVSKYNARRILEIGCGMEPLFSFLKDEYDSYTVIEPSDVFFFNAMRLKAESFNINCIHGFFGEERIMRSLSQSHYDLIICSSLLHEVESPGEFVRCMYSISDINTVVTVNVPNAKSFHRLLAKHMGLLLDEHDKTERNIIFQQHTVFDLESLSKLMEKKGFEIIDSGSYFIKPFTHKQMYQMMNEKIITKEVLDGLYSLEEEMPGMGSEIYVNCRMR